MNIVRHYLGIIAVSACVAAVGPAAKPALGTAPADQSDHSVAQDSGRRRTLSLSLKPVIRTTRAFVSVSDALDGTVGDAIASKCLVSSPAWGRSRTITRAEILKRLLHLTSRRVSVSGATTVTIERPGANRTGEIERAVAIAIDAAVESHAGIEPNVLPLRPIVLPPGRLDVECDVPDDLSGIRTIRCRLNIDGRLVKNVSVACRFTTTASVPLAAQRISRGDTLRPGDVVWEKRRFSSAVPKVIERKMAGGGFRAKRTIRRGDVVLLSSIERHPAVRAGDVVTLVFRRGHVRIAAKAKSLQTGWVGSQIRVRSLIDQSYTVATVTGKGVVTHD